MELRQTLSINLPIDLYQKLQQEVGKGKISKFIKEILEEKFAEKEDKLAQAYKECYTNNPHLIKEAKLWERAGIEAWLNYERGHYHKKSTKKLSKSTSKKAGRSKWQ